MKKCIICGNEFESSDGRIKTCSLECREKYKKTYSDRRREKSLSGIEGEDYIICKWCGQKTTRIYGQHIKFSHPNKTIEDYKKEFPGAPIYTKKDIENVSANSGKHMKEEKYRKMFSEMAKGEKNPMHRSKRTEQQRKESSPFSLDFYKKRNLSEKDYKIFLKEALKDREFDTTLEYYLKRGYSEDESKELLRKRQTTFSLAKCIEKYGAEEGLKRWKERQEKWKQKVFNSNTYIGGGRSMLAQHIIDEILLNSQSINEYLYGKNEKFIYSSYLCGARKYDLTHKENRKIIEINGIFWHCKPELYREDFYNIPRKMYAKDIWKYDLDKKELAESKGYRVLTIWEDDYIKFPNETIKKCIDFIYDTNA